jgi:hypothetical protein
VNLKVIKKELYWHFIQHLFNFFEVIIDDDVPNSIPIYVSEKGKCPTECFRFTYKGQWDLDFHNDFTCEQSTHENIHIMTIIRGGVIMDLEH